MNISLLAALAAMVFWGLGDFFIQKTTRRIGTVESLFFICAFGSVVLLPFVFNDLYLVFSATNITLMLFFLGIMNLVVALVNFQAYKIGKLSVVDTLLEIELPITALLGIFLLKESPTGAQLLLFASLFAGIVLISLPKLSFGIHKIIFERGALFAVLAATGMGFFNFLTATATRISSPYLAIWSAWLVSGIFCFLIILHNGKISGLALHLKNYKKIIFAEGFFDTVAWTLFAVALVNMPLSIATAISESYPVIGVLLGIFINKEKIMKHQILGVGLTLVSAFFLSLTIL